ncbi:MAG: dienelactone hydrolase [Nostocaceae cyanobacterium]|nr:dienelactone hydrolase [Nostocaceae cyanobacterium]
MQNNQMIRAFYRAVKVDNVQSPYNTIHLKITYPGQMSGSYSEKDMGIVPADSQQAPFPVVVFFSGVNCDAQIYQWLAIKLAERGLVIVTFNWVGENLPGIVALTPGMDITMWTPAKYGTAPTTTALPAILAELQCLQQEGILAGMLDLEKVILGGHSAGGRVVLENLDQSFFPQVVAGFGYAVHSAAFIQMGYPPGTILPLPSSLPILIMGGTRDGVIANSNFRYGISAKDASTSVMRTFYEGITSARGDSYLVLLEGANHFSIVYPFDPTTGRPFLDFPATQPEDAIRAFMAEIISLFIDAHVRQQVTASQTLKQLLNCANPLINTKDCK